MIQFVHKFKGTVYVTVELCENARSLAEVTTEMCSQPYIVAAKNIEVVPCVKKS